MQKRKCLSLIMAIALLFGSLTGLEPGTASKAQAAAGTVYGSEDLIVHYDMKSAEQAEGQLRIKDVSGSERGFDGIFRNPDNGRLVRGDEVGFAGFGGGSTSASSYIEIPKDNAGRDVLDGLNDVTVSALVNWENDGENRWIFGFGTVHSNVETGNKYFFATPRHGINNTTRPAAAGMSKAGWRNEALITGPATLPADVWKLVTVTFSADADRITLYIDGVKAASGSAKGVKLSEIIDSAAGFSGFIGKSIFQSDPYYKGKVADFRVYGRALTDQEAAGLFTEASGAIPKLQRLTLEDAKDSLELSPYLSKGDSLRGVTGNISLPVKGNNGVAIAWSSSRPDVLGNEGKVTRPAVDAADAEVQLTAELTYQGLTERKVFTLTVLKEFTDETLAAWEADKLIIPNSDNIKGNIRLATVGGNGTSIVWKSSQPAIVKGSAEAAADPVMLGRVARPDKDTAVTLTAIVTKGSSSVSRTFELTVKRNPGKPDYDAYFFAYFTGEYEGGEEISFALAEDPLKWRALNNGKSVIQSAMGEKGLRDPFIIRSPEGDKFYLLATDLKMGESTNFDQAQITGSHYMMIWESDDLVHWSEQRMVEVAPKKGGNTWAPEAFYDEKTGDYVVFWASSMKREDTYGKYPNGRPNGQYNVMYYATTRDFYTFSEPKVFIDDAFPTIDTTILEHNGTIYRFTKSEVNYKLYYEKANNIFDDADGIADNGFQFAPIAGTKDGIRGNIGHAGNNEGPTVFKDIHADKWYLFLDSWPYHVRMSTDLEDGQQFMNNLLPPTDYALPPGPRHGTVIPITRAEYERLQSVYGVEGPEPSEAPVVHYTFDPEDVDGTTVKDVSGNGHDAKLVGGAAIATADAALQTGASVELDGATGYVELPKNMIQKLNLEKMTIAAWFKADKNQANQRIFDFSSPTGRTVNRNTMYLSTQGDTGQLEFAIVTPFTEKFSSESSLLGAGYKYALRSPGAAAQAWHHAAVTIDGFDAVMYLDGKEVSRSSVYNVEPRMLLETSMNYIGKSRNSAHSLFAGKFDDFRIYNRALSEDEVAALADGAGEPGGEPPTGPELILHYDMKDIDGATVKDLAGQYDGTWFNPNNAERISGPEAGALSLSGGNVSSYIEIPQGVLNGLTDVTVSSLVNWKGERTAEWLFALGQDSNKYLFMTPKAGSGSSRAGLGITSWNNEAGADAGALKSGEWKLVTVVMSGTDQTIKLYIDGVEAASGSSKGYTLAQINNLTGRSGYVGRSFYSADPYFGGMIADFQIYDGALQPQEIVDLKGQANAKMEKLNELLIGYAAEKLVMSDILGANSGKDEIKSNLTLPAKGAYGASIVWSSQKPDVIGSDGKVTRPEFEQGDQIVVLTAVLTTGEHSVTKTFEVTVIRKPNDDKSVKLDAEALAVYNVHNVKGNLTLPQAGANGTTITWISEQPSVISPAGEVNRPAPGTGDITVKLTAVIRKNNAKLTKGFAAQVKELPQQEALKGYAFTYFTGEGSANGEQIYFGLSQGNDPLHWQQINGGAPVITSKLGEKGLRDPFIIRSPEGDKFYMIATDLKIYGNGDWGRAQTFGSRSIMVWESEDLVNWSEQRMAEIAPPEAGNTWAPEIFYDEKIGEYVVFWASKMFADESHTGSGYQQMLYVTTRDFHTFSKPAVYMDYGYSVIDTTMIAHNGKIYRFTKDERNNSGSSPNGKFVFQEVGDSVLGSDFKLIKEGIGKGTISAGEGPTIFKSNVEDKWYLFIDEFGGRGYVPFETTDLDSGVWTMSQGYSLPARPRHGTVIPVTQTEYDMLLAQIPAEKQPESGIRVTGVSLDRTEAELRIGGSIQLSATVAPAEADENSVVWTSTDDSVATVDASGKVSGIGAGSAVISVTTVDGAFMAVAQVTVLPASEGGAVLRGSGQVKPGATFEVIYGLSGVGRELMAQDITFHYDSERLEFVTAQSLDEAGYIIVNSKESAGEIRFLAVHMGERQQHPDADLMKLVFRVKADAGQGSARIAVDRLITADRTGLETDLAGAELHQSIVNLPGDYNQDDRVSIGDLAMMAKAYGRTSSDADWNAVRSMDLNGDGIIDIVDLSALARMILN